MGKKKTRTILTEVLFPDPAEAEKQEYKRYFTRELWSVEEFGALMAGMTPDEFKKYEKKTNNPKIYKKILTSVKLINKFYKSRLRNKCDGCFFFKKAAYFSPWRYIQWMAHNNIPIRKRFAEQLPFHLMELYLFFQLDNIKSYAQGKNLSEFNKNLYQKYAKEILEKHPHISRDQLYQRCKYAEIQLKDEKGKRKPYSEKYLKYEWLKEINPKPVGRPKKSPKRAKKP